MTLTSLFGVGYSAKCQHGLAMGMNENDCAYCHFIKEVLKTKPPFDLKCVDDTGTNLKKGGIYSVEVVIEKGIDAKGETIGVLLKLEGEGTGVSKYMYDISKFDWSDR